MARIDDLKKRLTDLRNQIEKAEAAASLSVEGHSLTNQKLTVLYDREAQLEDAIEEYYRGQPFQVIEFTSSRGNYNV